jgi:ParB-like chromosome segregation protein Spo0J
MPLDLKINPEYQKLVPRPTQEQYDALKLSIMTEGLLFKLEALEDGTIIDGHTRFQICQELNKTILEEQITIKKFDSELDAKSYIIEVNLKRRHLNDFQRVNLECLRLEIYREKAAQRYNATIPKEGEKGFHPVSSPNGESTPKFQVDKIIAQQSGVSARTVSRVLKIRKKSPENIIKELESGKRTIGSAYQLITEEERQESRNQVLAETAVKIPDDMTLIQGDFIEANVAPESVQLVLTDLPYSEKYLDLWDKLGEFAKRVLVPGGYLVTYCGHFHLPVIIEKLKKHLEYFWTISLTQQKHSLVHSRHVFCDWKPILVFYKPPLSLPDYFGDVINGAGMEKLHHDWQQAEAELEPIITKFCPTNGLILDPCAGSGTTLIAAKKMGRKSIGIETNPHTFAIMKKRVSEGENS